MNKTKFKKPVESVGSHGVEITICGLIDNLMV
jgi:hypothetical protein